VSTHGWDLSLTEARQIQCELRGRVVAQRLARPLCQTIRTIGGLDVHDGRGAAVVLSFPALEWLGGAIAEQTVSFPYVPGLLSFRELPALLAAIERLPVLPDLFLCDGQGLAHPRRFGIACHLGVHLARRTVGCAKSRLCGHHPQPGPERGECAPLTDNGDLIGTVVRTRANVKPLYVSVGHLVDLESAIEAVVASAPRYRLPEPLRLAHRIAKSGRLPQAHRDTERKAQTRLSPP